jgi:hypothetical protein
MWLARERGLAAATVLRYESTARRFLQQQAMAGGVLKPTGLTGADVNAFLLYLQGLTPLRLWTAVPPVGGWRLAGLPPEMTAADVRLSLLGLVTMATAPPSPRPPMPLPASSRPSTMKITIYN